MTCFFEFWERELLFVPNLSHETCLMCFFVVTVFYCFLQLLTLCINYNLCKPASHNFFFAWDQCRQSQAANMGSHGQSEHKICFIFPMGVVSHTIM